MIMEYINLVLEDKDTLIKLLIYVKTNVYPWIRLNRITSYDFLKIGLRGNKDVSLRQYLLKTMKQNNLECNYVVERLKI